MASLVLTDSSQLTSDSQNVVASDTDSPFERFHCHIVYIVSPLCDMKVASDTDSPFERFHCHIVYIVSPLCDMKVASDTDSPFERFHCHIVYIVSPLCDMKVAHGGTVLGAPHRVVELGETFIPFQVFQDYVFGLGSTTFAPGTYDLLKHNCNNFSNEVSQFLCGKLIPKNILDLPDEILSTPFGQTLLPLIESLSQGSRGVAFGQSPSNHPSQDTRRDRGESPDFLQLNSAIEELAKKDRKKKKKRNCREKESEGNSSAAELTPDSCSSDSIGRDNMAETDGAEVIELTPEEDTTIKRASDTMAEIEAEERKEREEQKKKQREPPIIFKDAVDIRVEFDALVGLIDGILSPEEQQSLEELHQYMLEDEGSWALGDGFLNFIGRLLHDKSLQTDTRVRILNVLALAALKDDVILLLHQDRREHVLMNYAHDIDRLSPEEQEALALFICNLFENLSSSEWLLYISEWQYCNSTISNIRVSTKVAVNSLLADNTTLQDRGSAIMHNLACKEVFDDVAVELTMAVLQYFNSSPPEEQLFRCMKALVRFCQISPQDVPQLIQMIGPEPGKFRGVSARVDELIDVVSSKLR
uniref:PPPDE domain-containing protein n=1 Tax=Timema shepardi TaxID=629360 RepID=A0A7R9G3X9_TIMSH|nr:unnamed protein product [Timema shepardi]